MKKIVLFFIALFLVSASTYADENQVTEFKSEDFAIQMQYCIGNSAAQVVKLQFLLTHQLSNQNVIVKGVNAYDEEGNSYNFYVNNGSGYWGDRFYIPNNQPRKIKMQVDAILSKVTVFSSLVFTVSTSNGTTEVTLRNVPITWK